MGRAIGRLRCRPDLVLVDGRQTPPLAMKAEAIVAGDRTSAAIAAASIVAKVLRDRVMTAVGRHYPTYGFPDHKGYGTVAHRRALARYGPCPWHRLSYRPVVLLGQGRLF